MFQDDQEQDTPEGVCFCGAQAVVPMANPYLCFDHAKQIVGVLVNDLNTLIYGERWEVWRARTIPRLVALLQEMPDGHTSVRAAVN